MKTASRRKLSGFTLVELLVVIAIIISLVALSFVGITSAMDKARKVSAMNSATSLETAIDSFYDQYGALPLATEGPFTTDSAEGRQLLEILVGVEPGSGATLKNPRKIPFFKGKDTKSKSDGLYYQAGVPVGLYDPWGNPYTVVLDHDYDQVITVAIPQAKIPNATDDGTIRGRNAVIYSLGKDPKAASIPPQDLIRSWSK